MKMLLVKSVIIILCACCLLGHTSAVDPCDTASQYIIAASVCQGSSNFTSSLLNDAILNAVGLSDSDGVEVCSDGFQTLQDCMVESFSECDASLKMSVEESLDEYRGQYCEQVGGTWQYSELAKEYFEKIGQAFISFGQEAGVENGTFCFTEALSASVFEAEGSCGKVTADLADVFLSESTYIEIKDSLTSTYGAYVKCLYQEMNRGGCSDDASFGFLAITVLYMPVGISYGLDDLDVLVNTEVKPFGSVRASVKVFGDPHVKISNGVYMTCSSEGKILYLSNDYVDIYGVNTAVTGAQGSQPATFMTEVEIALYDTDGKNFANYVFNGGDSLPDSFDGLSDIDSDKATIDVTSSGVTRIVHEERGIVIGLKKISHTLAMTVRMEQSLYTFAVGLLVTGCPGEEINIAFTRRKRQAASEVCEGTLNLSGDELNACVYDVGVTQDPELVSSQYEAVAEMESAVEELDESIIVPETESSASCVLGHMITVLLTLIGCNIIL